jgi:hypothetical protein
MKVFLSWSGERSHGVAQAFHDWMPTVLQEVDPFLSTKSIKKGATWLNEIREALGASNGVGLFFLTAQAVSSPWLLFEAGGVAALGERRVCTVLVDLQTKELEPPLSLFQWTSLNQGDVRKLVEDLNTQLSKPLSQNILDKSFGRAWPELEARLKELSSAAAHEPEKRKTLELDAGHLAIENVLESLRRIENRIGAVELHQRNLSKSAESLSGSMGATEYGLGSLGNTIRRAEGASPAGLGTIAASLARNTPSPLESLIRGSDTTEGKTLGLDSARRSGRLDALQTLTGTTPPSTGLGLSSARAPSGPGKTGRKSP